MPARRQRRRRGFLRRANTSRPQTEDKRALRFQTLESRQLLAADLGEPLADITGLWITVGDREYFTSEQAAVTIDMVAGETLQVSGIRYGLDESVSPNDGVIAFESYVRREHGASDVGSFDYTDGRFADPIPEDLVGGEIITHPGFDSGWQLEVIDNRVAVVAIRYFGDEFVVEDRLLFDVNVVQPDEATTWTEALTPIKGDWEVGDDELGGDSRADKSAGLTVIETDSAGAERYEVSVKAKTVEENTYANGFVVLDYHSENDFVYAGLRSIADKWVIGHFDGNFNDLAWMADDIVPRQEYDIRVAVEGSHVALAADGILRATYDFDHALTQGSVGLANQYAFTHFKDFHFFDNTPTQDVAVDATSGNDGEETTPNGHAQALEEARANVEETQVASERAAALANEAELASREAASNASHLSQVSEIARLSAQDATRGHSAAYQALRQAETQQVIAAQAIQDAKAELSNSNERVEQAQEILEEATEEIEDIIRRNESAAHEANELAARYQTAQQAADDAALVSEAATIAADVAREASDIAEQAAEDAEDAPKKERKALEKEARDAEKRADKAEKEAEKLADEAEDAADDAAELKEKWRRAQELANEASNVREDLSANVHAAETSLNSAQRAQLDAENRLADSRAAKEAASETVDRARDDLARASDIIVRENANAEHAEREAELASQAAIDAELNAQAARAESDRLADLADVAQVDFLAAELAAQQPDPLPEPSTDPSEEEFRAYSLNFNHQDDGAFETVAGNSDRVAGQLHLTTGDELVAVSVLDNEALPDRTATRVYTTVRADAVANLYKNGFIVFDYQSPEDFKYAGAWAGADRWAIGEVVQGEFTDVVALDEVIGEGPAYELQVWIEDSTLTFLVEGQEKLKHTFDESVDDGRIGVATYNSQSRFDQVAVMQLYGGSGDVGIENGNPEPTDPSAHDAAITELF